MPIQKTSLIISRTLDCGCVVTTGGDRIWCGKCQEAGIILQGMVGFEKLSRENGNLRTENAILTKQKKFCLDRIEELVRENKSLQSSLFLAKEQIECDKEQVTALYAEIAKNHAELVEVGAREEKMRKALAKP